MITDLESEQPRG